ncbi:Transglutaminase-like superfamily protein [Gemmata sp. SH-PL17]|uniref:transglutaminase-like domain-containing protein n=1 Tax=Gemmata sp. SH-PL17 TaxID=1630693 RepID=UPI0004B8AC40|nr:transglutaminase domain-containing protein [Gemmata sp. SH-PL17]AMV29881.1 Transglutaminase-like superfamily protein [Gemmata sp. SH-PL17]
MQRFGTFLSLAACALFAAYSFAQPTKVDEQKNFVIRPKAAGGSGGTNYDTSKFIVIRPNGNVPSLVTQPTTPAQPTTPSTQPVAGRLVPGMIAVPPPGTPKVDAGIVFDYWFAAAVDGQRIGYVQWGAKKVKQNDRELLVGVKHQKFTVSRFGQVVSQWGEESSVENTDGDVLITGMRQGIGQDQALVLNGVVDGKTLKVTGEGAAKGASNTPWPEGVVGCVREPALFKEKRLKTGASFDYPAYIGVVNRVVKMTVTLEAEETLALWPKEPARKLLRFVSRMEPVGNFKLPPATTWVDAETFEPLKMEFDFPGFGGKITFLRTTKESATVAVARPVELFNAQSIRLDREIPGIHAGRSVVYKVTAPKDDEPGTLFAEDARQTVKNPDAKAKSFELHVSAAHGPIKGAAVLPAPGKEFTASNYFINWDNDGVKGHAAAAMRGLPATATDWEKAVAIERWVHRNMKAFEFSQAMATADNVAKTLSGDCTEYAMLGAAMSRAVGVPSRTVLGLVYAPAKDGKPYLAYHMWFEVFADGQWLPLDATLGGGGVGPGHLKIADHSWHDEKTFAPLLPVLRVLSAKPAVTVGKVEP